MPPGIDSIFLLLEKVFPRIWVPEGPALVTENRAGLNYPSLVAAGAQFPPPLGYVLYVEP